MNNLTSQASPTAPASFGFAHPAEWEHHEATWIAWPHNRTDWPGKMAPIPWVYSEIVRRIAPGEIVRILVNSGRHEASARRALARTGVDISRVQFFPFVTDRGWTRDSGPIFLRQRGSGSEVAIIKFRFNAWAKYADWKNDDAVAKRASRALGMRIFTAIQDGHQMVVEGGSIDLNGRGTLITTQECLLDQKVQPRNPSLDQQQIEAGLKAYLGVSNILWLGRGIAGDDTHGHVDDLCRFVNPTTVVLCRTDDPNDENFGPLEENRERLETMRLETGSRIDVVPMPMPAPLYFDGRRLPASYANFYISNSAVLVPTFNDPNDRQALGILSELITDRPVIGIHAVDLVWGLGTLHCLTHEQPSGMKSKQ
jgi:agmatine deiminase